MRSRIIFAVLFMVWAILAASCASSKYGCPPSKIHKLKFNK